MGDGRGPIGSSFGLAAQPPASSIDEDRPCAAASAFDAESIRPSSHRILVIVQTQAGSPYLRAVEVVGLR